MKGKVITTMMLTLSLAIMLFTAFESAFSPTDSLVLEGVKTWYWEDDTYIRSVAYADVDEDGSVEIVTGGWYLEWGARWWAQLAVWDGATLSLEDAEAWYWVTDTEIWSVAIADVDGDGAVEIVTGGWSWGEKSPVGLVKVPQLCVWGWV